MSGRRESRVGRRRWKGPDRSERRRGPGRVSLLGFAVMIACLVAGPGSGVAANGADRDSASVSIVNGTKTTISKWPWQVALIDQRAPAREPLGKFFCSGSLLAPDLVVTAAHCVVGYSPSTWSRLRVISGRTWLNKTSSGTVHGVNRVVFALDDRGKRRYRQSQGTATWDVALIKLDTPSPSPTIKIAGNSEARSWSPGRPVKATGWGDISGFGVVSNVLRLANQVILPKAVCQREDGSFFSPKTMLCFGGPAGHSSTCSGDSGGPLVTPVGGDYRLVGLTSFGDFFCRGYIPSVDTRVAGDPIRSWVRGKALALSGIDPVGREGAIGPKPEWCRVPGLFGRSRTSARTALRNGSCTVSRIRRVRRAEGAANRVVGSSLPQGWLAPKWFGITLRIGRR